MACPKCNSNDLWDDQMWWGCNSCGWKNGGSVRNQVSRNDRVNGERLLPASTESCRTCGNQVPEGRPNPYYCSDSCQRAGWRANHTEGGEPDWERVPPLMLM